MCNAQKIRNETCTPAQQRPSPCLWADAKGARGPLFAGVIGTGPCPGSEHTGCLCHFPLVTHGYAIDSYMWMAERRVFWNSSHRNAFLTCQGFDIC